MPFTKGHKFNQEVQARMTQKQKENPPCGFRGKKHTEDHKEFMSKRMKEVRMNVIWGGLKGDANPSKRPEVRDKISKANTGNKSKRIGKTLEEEHGVEKAAKIRQKQSESHKGQISALKGKENLKFESNPNWKGGAIDSFKRMCLIRDDFTCSSCGLRDVDIMEVDHVKKRKDFPELYLELSNLTTLCPNCHARKTITENGKMGYRQTWKQRYKVKNVKQYG